MEMLYVVYFMCMCVFNVWEYVWFLLYLESYKVRKTISRIAEESYSCS